MVIDDGKNNADKDSNSTYLWDILLHIDIPHTNNKSNSNSNILYPTTYRFVFGMGTIFSRKKTNRSKICSKVTIQGVLRILNTTLRYRYLKMEE